MSDVPVSGAAFRETFLQALDQVLGGSPLCPAAPFPHPREKGDDLALLNAWSRQIARST